MIDWKPAWEAFKARSHVASTFKSWRAVVRIARGMSEADARATLGLGPSYSREDVQKAWKQLTRQYHPDRPGGSTEMMAKVNVAAETLLQQGVGSSPPPGRSPWEDVRRRTEEAEARAREDYQKRREEDQRKQEEPVPEPPGQSYSSILGRGSGIEWKIISQPTYFSEWVADDDTPPEGVSRSVYQVVKNAYIAFGLKDGKGFLLGLVYTLHKRGDYSYSAKAEAWEADLFPLRVAPERGIPAALKKWSEMHTPGWRPRAKWHVLDGRLPTEDQLKKISRGGISLKEALSGLGMAAGGKAVKPAVQLAVKQKPRAEFYRIKETLDKRRPENHRLYDFILTVNGKGRELSEREIEALSKNLVLFGLFGYAYWEFDGRTINLHKSRKYPPQELLPRLHEALDSGPLKDAVGEAAQAYGGEVRTARYDRRRVV